MARVLSQSGPAAALALAGLLLTSAAAHAQNGDPRDSVADDAVDAVAQPLTDLNLRQRDIPPILEAAAAAPYDLSGLDTCPLLGDEIMRLEDVLGPDADAPEEERSLISSGLRIGGRVLSGFIPFRGLVREISGANAEKERWEAHLYAGVARRSYLKGVAYARNCPSLTETSLQSAQSVLGLAAGEGATAPE